MTELLQNPLVIKVLLVVGGGALGFGAKAAVHWLRSRGNRRLGAAIDAFNRAKLTPDEQDDAIAALALERAKTDAEWMQWLATEIENKIPTLPGAPKP